MDESEATYEAEIEALQEEIAVLQEQQQTYEREMSLRFADHLPSALSSLRAESAGPSKDCKEDGVAHLLDELEELEADLTRQDKINGFVLTDCKIKTLEKSDAKVVQEHRVSGHCGHLTFQVEFQLTETQDAAASRTITGLNIVVDGSEFTEFGPFVSRVEDEKSLLLFFRTLRGFSEWCWHRSRTFMHFKNKYPDVVSLPEGCRAEVMTIRNPKLPSCVMTIVWKIDVSKEGQSTAKVELLPKMPEQAIQLDQQEVLDHAPASFQSLLRIMGVEAAMESLIKAVCVE